MFIFLVFAMASAQLITVSMCHDAYCVQCAKWTATSGKCTACETPPCSSYNPSTIITLSSLNLYADDSCSVPVNWGQSMVLTSNGQCNQVYTSGNIPYAFMETSNLSMILGITIGSIVFLIVACILCYRCRCRTPPPAPPIVMMPPQLPLLHPAQYAQPQYAQPQYAQPQFPYT